jgi:dTDP-glucose pyrophosphorylase
MKELIGLIAAAGKGMRLHPDTEYLPKPLLKIDGIPILQRNIELMRDSLGIRQIYILVGYKKEMIVDAFGDGKKFGVAISYIIVDNIEQGLAEGVYLAKEKIHDIFCLILGDEVYYRSNHSEMLELLEKDFSAVCAIKEVKSPFVIKKNYSVEIDNGQIISLVEKPEIIKNNYLGCGTYLLKPDFFDFIKITPPSLKTKRVELIDVINLVAQKTGKVYPFMLKGEYVNVNNIDSYNLANYTLRSFEFSKKSLSLIIPAYNEELSLPYVIDDFKDKVGEIVVVDNNSQDRTKERAEAKGVRVLTGRFRGYGDALKFGMDNAKGDIFILVEADGSFFARDMVKLLEYLKDADMVLGTRTTKQMIEQAANMPFLLRWGNVVVAKLLELLWLVKEPRLTDVGCTYRGIWRSAYLEIRDSLKGVGPEFSPEMIVEAIHHNKRVIEIPITYSGRLGGESKFSKNLLANSRTALRMLKLIFWKRIQYFFR